MSFINTILPEDLRKAHAENEHLGCGNFLHVAVEVSPFADQRHFFLDRPVTLFTGEVFDGFSLRELLHAVDTYASWYYGVGVRAKDPVAVYVSEGIENVIHYLALNAIGAIPTIVNGNMRSDIAALWMAKVGATGLYTDERLLSRISPHVRENMGLRFVMTDKSAGSVYKPSFPKQYPFLHAEQDAVLVGHSSGTTGIPKAVQFSHQQFFHGIRYRLGLPFAKGSERILSALPHSHSAGIAYVMLAVLNGCSVMILSGNDADRLLSSAEEFQPTMVVAFPETYVNLNDANLDDYDLSSVQLWFNGGDAAHEAHIRKLIAKGHHFVDGKRRQGSLFIDGLGSSEMGFSLFRNVHSQGTENYNRCIGKPLEWVDAAVLGETGEKLPPYRIGRLGVKAPSITPGYWNDSVLTARSQLSGYFLTGDLFYYDEENRFFHVDRVPDAIETKAGKVYSLATEERIMKTFPEVLDVTVVASPLSEKETGAVAIVRLRKGESASAQALLTQFNELLRADGLTELALVMFCEPSEVPLGPTGKVLKRELREMMRAKVVGGMHV